MNSSLRQGFVSSAILFFLVAMSMPVAGQTLPAPGNDTGSSLLGIVVGRAHDVEPGDIKGKLNARIDGPTRLTLRIGNKDRELFWFRVKPGNYVPADNTSYSVNVPESSVVLAPFRLVRRNGAEQPTVELLDESDRQFAGAELSSYVGFPLWSQRDFIGFGTLRPEIDPETARYTVSLTSNVQSTEIYLNDVLAGMAPMELTVGQGKHRILLRSAGYEDEIYFVRLEGDAVINAEMKEAAVDDMKTTTEAYRTVVGPFVPLGETNDQLSRLFADTLLLTLEEDPRLAPFPSALPWVQRLSLIQPDFLSLEEAGVDLVVGGFFDRNQENLIIQANLYDVQAETVRAAVTWYGVAGLDIFDAMDQIAEEFAGEVDKVLPEAGRALITRQETVYSGMNTNEGQISRKKVLKNRWETAANVLTIRGGIEGLFETYTIESGVFTKGASRNGPAFPVTISWDRDIGDYFAVGTGIRLAATTIRQELPGGEEENDPAYDLGIFGGPRLVFRSLRSDISMNVDLQVRFSPEYSYRWEDIGTQSGEAGPFLYLQLPIEISFRYYLNKRTDRMPFFLSGSIGISPLGYRFDLAGRNQAGWVDADFSMNFGAGIRL